MNSTFYIFGKFNGSYAQFPVDYTQDIFQQLPNRSTFANTQLVIHRDGNLMYYCYMRKLEHENYIGFCLLLNDAMIEEIPALFEHFDHAVTELALKGEIIKINDQGEVVSNTQSLLTNQQAIKQTASSLFAQLSSLVTAKKTLPTQSFACDRDETKTFMLTDNNVSWIIESSLKNGYTIITKEDNSSNLDTYQQTIKRLQKEKEELLAQKNDQDHHLISTKTLWMFYIAILIVGVIYTFSDNWKNLEKVIQPTTESSEVKSDTSTSVQNTYTPNSSVQTSSTPTNSIERIKQNSENRIMAESSDALYYLGEEPMTLYRFDKRDLSTQAFSYDNTMMHEDPHDGYFYDNLLVLIGKNNANAGKNIDVALFFDTRNKRFVNTLYATNIERKGKMLIIKKTELLVNNGYSAANEHFYWNEYYDLRGNWVDGKTIRGKGSIGNNYPIEISMHCLQGKITGWYKYEGHTNYMTIKGTVDEYNHFTFVEYNEKGERFGTFEGYADFQSKTLDGVFRKGSRELDFTASDSETW